MIQNPKQPTPKARYVNIITAMLGFALALLSVLPVRADKAPLTTDLPSALALTPVTVDGARLMALDKPFEVHGVNYVRPTATNPACPELHFGADGTCAWDLAAIDADLDRFQALGVNTVRIFLNYYVFGGTQATNPDYSLEQPLAHLDAFIADANQRGIYVLPVLLAKYPQDRFGAEHYDEALRLHIRPVVSHLAGRPGILAWDLFNEPDIGSPIDERCWDWDNGDFPLCLPLANERMRFLNRLHYDVKYLDPQRLTTIGMAFAKSYFRPAAAEMQMAYIGDFYSFHYYDNDPYDSGRYAAHWYYGQGFPLDLSRSIDELFAMRLNKPVLVTELGFPSGTGALRNADDLRRDLRLAVQTTRERGAAGLVLWPFQPTPEELLGDLFQD